MSEKHTVEGVVVPGKRATRVVFIDGCTMNGVGAAEAFRKSDPVFGLKASPIILLERQENSANVLLSREKERLLGTVSDAIVQTTDPRPNARLPPFKPLHNDLFVHVSDGPIPTNLLKEVLTLASADGSRPSLMLVVTKKGLPSLQMCLAEIAAFNVVVIKVPYLAASALFQPKNLDVSQPLESFCLGVALGVTRVVKVNASQPADIVPLDIAINTALASLYLYRSKRLPGSVRNANHVIVDMVGNTTTALVWGMIGEYVLDYYGRYSDIIHKEIPSGLFDSYPSVLFKANLPDLWNYGLSLSAPVKAIRNTQSNRIRAHLKRFPHATTMEAMKTMLSTIDSVLDGVVQFAPAGAAHAGYDGKTYAYILRLLTTDLSLQPLLFLVDLDRVQWEMYVKNLAVQVLHHLTLNVLNHTGVPLSLPPPKPYFYNCLIFRGDDRMPEFGFRMRRIFSDVYGVMRAGQQPNGGRIVMHPGRTHSRIVGIVAQPHIQLIISKLAKEQNVPKDAVEKRAYGILMHIGDTQSHRPLRIMAWFLRKILHSLYHRIHFPEGTYDKLFRAFNSPRRAVVVVPTHRSYVDFLVMSYMLLEMGLPMPHICSGEDFLKLGPASEMLRGSGAFFMRRSFQGDKLYGSLFKEYVRQLTRDAQCLEFFTEGTRSRTQKTMAPKFGFMKMITDAFLEKQEEIDDVLFIPVSMSYDRVLEGNVYANELLGVPKPPETMGNLLRSATILKDDYGSLNVIVGDPISLSSYAAQPLQCPEGYQPKAAPADFAPVASSRSSGGGESSTPGYLLNAMGWRIHFDLQRNLVVPPTALLAAVLQTLYDPAQLKNGVPIAMIASSVEWVRSLVLHRGHMNDYLASSDGGALTNIAAKHLVGYVRVTPFSHIVVDDKDAATPMLLNIYSNQLIHLFGDEGVVCVAAFASLKRNGNGNGNGHGLKVNNGANNKAAQSPSSPTSNGAPPAALSTLTLKPSASQAVATLPRDASDSNHLNEEPETGAVVTVSDQELSDRVHFVQDLLSLEFPNYQSASPISHTSWMNGVLSVMEESNHRSLARGSDGTIVKQTMFTTFVTQLVYPLVDSYYVALLVLRLLVKEKRIVESLLLDVAHHAALALTRSKKLDYVVASSKETLKNAFQRFRSHGVTFVEGAPANNLSLKSNYTKDDGAPLDALIGQVNDLRWHPATAEGIAQTHAEVLDVYRNRIAASKAKVAKPKL